MLSRLSPPARVGLNAHLLSLTATYRGAGIANYILQLLRHLPAAANGAFDLVAFLYTPGFVPPPGLTVCRSRWDTRQPWRRILWEQTQLAVATRKLDLLHGLAYAAPLAAACPTVITIHDLSFLRFKDAFRPWNRIYLTLMTRAAARRAVRVIADSESTRQDVISLCGVSAERVVTIPIGVTEEFRPGDRSRVAEFRRRQGLPERYILYLGTLEPRKNLVRLVEAFAQVRAAMPEENLCLVIAGAKGWFYQRIFTRVAELGLRDAVIFPGYVPESEKPAWYQGAELFVYPSLFEGFGLPVLEALACGIPTITSAVSALPEVAGDAALLVADPDDAEAWAAAMRRVLTDADLAAQLQAAGPRRAAQFSWQRTAAETLAVYRRCLGGPR